MQTLRMGVFHNSNLFFRDIQYAISEYCRVHEGKLPRYAEAEKLAKEVVAAFESAKIFDRIGEQAFRLDFPAFELPRPEVAPKAAPAAETQPA